MFNADVDIYLCGDRGHMALLDTSIDAWQTAV